MSKPNLAAEILAQQTDENLTLLWLLAEARWWAMEWRQEDFRVDPIHDPHAPFPWESR